MTIVFNQHCSIIKYACVICIWLAGYLINIYMATSYCGNYGACVQSQDALG